MYIVIGKEAFNYGQIQGIHSSKNKAKKQAEYLEQNKKALCCQSYMVMTKTEIKQSKITLYS